MGRTMRISCVGAGPAGLYFSILAKISNPEHEITVYERSAAGSSYGWGVSFGPDLVQKLYGNDPESAREMEDSALRWRNQSVDIHGKHVTYHGSTDVYNINRPRLVEILGARAQQLGIKICYGEEITSPTQVPDSDLIVAGRRVEQPDTRNGPVRGTVRIPTTERYIWLGTQQPSTAPAYHYIQTECGWIWGYLRGRPGWPEHICGL